VLPDRAPERGEEDFAEQLRALIHAQGSITLEAYMAACNERYYATRDPLGAAGDFITAPEISQMFGELVGVALADCWQRAGRPESAIYVELGPGRGTLAADALRAMGAVGLHPRIALVENSPALRAKQAERVPQAIWHKDLTTIDTGPVLLVANEFLDALPIRQWVGETERRVVCNESGLAKIPDGQVREDSPVQDAIIAALAERLATQGGIALIIDYGHSPSAPGDTLQAVRRHRFADPLNNPGEQDLTAHVDFERIGRVAQAQGVAVHGPIGQGQWLEKLGIAARAAVLAKASPQYSAKIESARDRLCGTEAMGDLFKVIALRNNDWPIPAGFAR
jgi:SAM-dependent MidA family methyltransferase